MLFDWFDAREAISFADEVAKEIDRLLMAPAPGGRSRSVKKGSKQFDALFARVREFSKKRNLNIFKKARFLNTIKWKLQDSGQDDTLVKEIVALLTIALNA